MKQSPQVYQVHILDQSYYSGKLHSYLKYKNIPINTHEIDFVQWWKTGYPNTGLMKMPFAQTPDGQWLQDSTPMLDWFENKYPQNSILPEDPAMQFFCRLIEDYADEWHWRPAMHYRWSYQADAAVNSIRFRDTLMASMPGPAWLNSFLAKKRQYKEYITKDGVTAQTRDHVESIYLNALKWMEAILTKQDFLLGDKPSLIDFGFMASMFRHYSIDPTPAKIMRDTAPNVYLWVARMWAAKGENYQDKQWHYKNGELPELLKPFIKDICQAYLPYLLANAQAWNNKQATCSYTVQGVTYKNTKTYDYRVWCREQLIKHFNALPSDAKQAVEKTLKEYGGWEAFTAEQDIKSNLDPENLAPVRRAIKPKMGLNLRTFFSGTPWSTSNR
ncbi:MAG: glutathione S-transferase N-terminal domain-containing protein [Bermanella sp.]